MSLQRFAALGRIDFGLDLAEAGEAVNAALAAAGAGPSVNAEHVANGAFVDWNRLGKSATAAGTLGLEGTTLTPGLDIGPDGSTVYLTARDDGGARFLAFDVFSRSSTLDTPLGSATPTALLLGPGGGRALVALSGTTVVPEPAGPEPEPDPAVPEPAGPGAAGPDVAAASQSFLRFVDTATGAVIGNDIPMSLPVVALVASPDRRTIFGLFDGETTTTVAGTAWDTLVDAARPGAVAGAAENPALAELSGAFRGAAATPGGGVAVLTDQRLAVFDDLGSLADGSPRDLVVGATAMDVAASPSGAELLVLETAAVQVVAFDRLNVRATIPLTGATAPDRIAVDQLGQIAVVSQDGPLLALDIDRRALLDPGPELTPGLEDPRRTGLAISPTGAHVVVAKVGVDGADLIALGATEPAEWQLAAGEVRPLRLAATGTLTALLGRQSAAKAPHGPAVMTQVVPVRAGARYRFTFDGFADSDTAEGQLVWRDATGAPLRTERRPVTFFDADARRSLAQVPHHDLTAVAPDGATQADVRLLVPEGTAAVAAVSLAGSADALNPTAWAPETPTIAVTAGPELVITNSGPATAAVGQTVGARAGDVFALRVVARTDAASLGAAVVLRFADDAAAPIGPEVRVALDPFDFDERAAAGVVPAGATEAAVRIEVPTGAVVTVDAVSLLLGGSRAVDVHLVSEAPGELTMTDVAVRLDAERPQPPPVPPAGLSPPLPVPGTSDDGGRCAACGGARRARVATPTATPAGRPAVAETCPTCGATRLRLGGRLRGRGARAGAELPDFRPRRERSRSGGPQPPRTRDAADQDSRHRACSATTVRGTRDRRRGRPRRSRRRPDRHRTGHQRWTCRPNSSIRPPTGFATAHG